MKHSKTCPPPYLCPNVCDEVITVARGWIGTPYRHQASAKGVGADCLGLLRGVWRTVYGSEPETPPPYSMDWGEAAAAPLLLYAAQRHLIRKDLWDAALGDVLLFQMREGFAPKHLGIQSKRDPDAAFIHAYSGHTVCESPLSSPWVRHIYARFAFPPFHHDFRNPNVMSIFFHQLIRKVVPTFRIS